MSDHETAPFRLANWPQDTDAIRDALADIAAAIREHTATMNAAEERSNTLACERDTRQKSEAAALREYMESCIAQMQQIEVNAERRQIESEGRTDERMRAAEAAMDARVRRIEGDR